MAIWLFYIFICTITIITFVVVFPKLHEATIPTIALYALFIVITINLSIVGIVASWSFGKTTTKVMIVMVQINM
jgi:hypothetical protein